ncbi:unnamed protein product [Clonostachys rosea]|uniref:2EXR domain-containing protein n=1 Tax=Bionectria ochroleuca TaxID=29856 RepID=A0ABY6TT82_BIOOC|nr:unnamed protein product [Clonostachys rosea]
MASNSFSIFSNLPPELRLKIWSYALPEDITNLLYVYKRGCWSARPILESDERYDSQHDNGNWSYDFCPDLLPGPTFKVRLGFVNHESREVALTWVRAQTSGLVYPGRTVSPVFRRAFDVCSDTLYVAPGQWNDFLREPMDEFDQQGPIGRDMEIHGQVEQLAVSETLIRSGSYAPPDDLVEYYNDLRVLYIIINPGEGEADMDPQTSKPCRYRSIPGGCIFSWDHTQRIFEFLGGDNSGDEAFDQLIYDFIQGLREGLIYMEVAKFEVRLVTKHDNQQKGIFFKRSKEIYPPTIAVDDQFVSTLKVTQGRPT